jgi:hypothetical protein
MSIFKNPIFVDTQPIPSVDNLSLLRDDSNTIFYPDPPIYPNGEEFTIPVVNRMDILDQNKLSNIFSSLNTNNSIVFQSLLNKESRNIRFDKSKFHFYGLSSTELDDYGKDFPYGKNSRIHIEPFLNDPDWEYLDRVTSGAIYTDSGDSFKYLCTTGTDLITLSANITDKTPLTLIKYEKIDRSNYIFSIHYDIIDDRIFIIDKKQISIYKASTTVGCDNINPIDYIPLNKDGGFNWKWSTKEKFNDATTTYSNRFGVKNLNNAEFIKFGRNIRTQVEDKNLLIYGKYTTQLLSTYNIADEILAIDIRQSDDLIAILTKNGNIYSINYVNLVSSTITKQNLDEFISTKSPKIKFSAFDSNIIYTVDDDEVQMRYVNDSLKVFYRITDVNLLYPKFLKFEDASCRYNNIRRKWNTKKMPSNNFNNILIDDKNIGDNYRFLIHNIGRIYILSDIFPKYKEDLEDVVNLNFFNFSSEVLKGRESSFGLYINVNLNKVVDDLVSIYQKYFRSYSKFSNDEIDVILKNLKFQFSNYYMNGNETFNVLVFRRIIENIANIQSLLISESINLNK